ncbi:hypothetical protein C8Q80DRAFT_379194 [Daedaleopsis nitida]|nr:hypothetical protein C8Q80DRAFT_379194 [Daedaleopsis nitida]
MPLLARSPDARSFLCFQTLVACLHSLIFAMITKAIAPSAVLLGLSLFLDSAWAGTRCASRQLDWYTDVVGENPCETYQRLRQICNPGYKVRTLGPAPPGDRCDDPDSTCCCNTISFQLSMLCEVCQNDREAGSSTGIDAPIGTYIKYVQGCIPWKNDELPPKVQASVCAAGIRLDDGLYNSWEDGAWF